MTHLIMLYVIMAAVCVIAAYALDDREPDRYICSGAGAGLALAAILLGVLSGMGVLP